MPKPSIILVPGSFAPSGLYDSVADAVTVKGYVFRALHYPSIGLKAGPREGEPPTMYEDAAFIAKEVGSLVDEGKDGQQRQEHFLSSYHHMNHLQIWSNSDSVCCSDTNCALIWSRPSHREHKGIDKERETEARKRGRYCEAGVQYSDTGRYWVFS